MSYRILVCDDETHITRAVGMKLDRAGFNVETVPHGRAAWEAIERDPPALLITDCQMPHMSGLQLARRVRSTPEIRNLPVILLTAKGFELDEEQLKSELDIARVVLKPFSPRELLETVREVLGAVSPVGDC